jgi:drug/metabolite transporter (DMT)-like permease
MGYLCSGTSPKYTFEFEGFLLESTTSGSTPLNRRGLADLLIVYIVWGSTYLAIRFAVREGAGFPPFTLAFLRVFAASFILLTMARMKGERIKLTRQELGLLAGSGVLLWVGGNGLVTWAEMRASSGMAALLVAAMPIWSEIISSILDRKRPGALMTGSILLGFSGVGVLSWPVLRHGSTDDLLAVVALLLAPLFWAIGSIWYQRRKSDLKVRAVSGWQHLLGGVGFLVVIFLRGEPMPAPTQEAWLALLYLIIFGSVIAFTAYMSTLQVLPFQIVMTYAYVNPVIAVFLGWLILDEAVTMWTMAGTVLVVAGVAGIFKNRQ